MPQTADEIRITDLTEEHQNDYFHCLEEWSADIKEAGDHKSCWFRKFQSKGFRVKLAMDSSGRVGGMIQYLPIEESFAEGRNLYVIHCIWVHGHKQGRGNFQKRGFGQALLKAAEEDAQAMGAKGIAAWGLWLPFWMKASWFKKHGYKKVDRIGIRVLLWKKFSADAEPPRWIREKKRPRPTIGKVTVTSFLNGWCPAMNLTHERAKRACESFGERVVFQTIDTTDRATFLEWGISDAVFIGNKPVRTGPPPSYEKIRRAIEKKVR